MAAIFLLLGCSDSHFPELPTHSLLPAFTLPIDTAHCTWLALVTQDSRTSVLCSDIESVTVLGSFADTIGQDWQGDEEVLLAGTHARLSVRVLDDDQELLLAGLNDADQEVIRLYGWRPSESVVELAHDLGRDRV